MKASFKLFIFCFLGITANTSFGQTIDFESFALSPKGYITLLFEGTPVQKVYKKELILFNSGDKDLIITKVESGCDCVKSKISKKILKPQESAKISIRWSPPQDAEFSSSISVFSNDTKFGEIWVQMIGNMRS